MTRFHSKLLDENADVADDGSVTFASGVVYTPDEIAVLKGRMPEDVVGIHRIRRVFDGALTFCGKAEIFKMPEPFLAKVQNVSRLKEETLFEEFNNEQLSLF